jgi:hypothetical protein
MALAAQYSSICWVLLHVQSLQQLQQQLAESSSKLREYAAADGLIERAITTAASAGGWAPPSPLHQLFLLAHPCATCWVCACYSGQTKS